MHNLTIHAHINSNQSPHQNYQFRPRSLPEYNEKKRLYIAIVNLKIEYQQSICASLTTGMS